MGASRLSGCRVLLIRDPAARLDLDGTPSLVADRQVAQAKDAEMRRVGKRQTGTQERLAA